MTDASEFFREMTLRICGSLDIDQALQEAFEVLRQHVPAESIGLGHWSADASKIEVLSQVACHGATPVWGEGKDEILLSEVRAAELHETDWPPLTLINRPEDPAAQVLSTAFPGLTTQSAVFLRLDVRGEEVGALLISAEGRDRYSPRDAELLQTLR